MSDNAAHLPEGTLVAGKLRILRLLGMGGMGAVYEIEHEITKHRRALKMLHAHFRAYPNVIARFLREASAAGRIGNPHIIETFDAGELDTGEPYLVMEFLEGGTLSDLLGRKGRLELTELAELIRQACDGVQAAHEAGIIHRDLKPDNLYVISRGGKPFVKILDFGVSKFDAELTGGMGMTKEGSTLGTPFYMPPEQVRGEKDVDARADVYALGIILYECASGKRPFEAETLPHLALLIHEGKPTPLEQLCPHLPPSFVEVVARAMACDRALRFGTARELSEALAPFADDDAFGATMAEGPGVTVPPVAAQPRARSVLGSDSSALGPTMPGSAISIAGEGGPPSRGSGVLGVALAAGALALAGGAYLLTRSSSPPAPVVAATAVSPEPPASAGAILGSNVATPPAPSVPSSPTTPDAGDSTQAGSIKPPGHTGSTRPFASSGLTSSPTAPPPTTTHPPPPNPPPARTRVDQRGLANDNPFQ